MVRLEPDGLEFAIPATLHFEMEPLAVSEELAETGLPFLLSKRSGEVIELLGAQSLDIDLDTGARTLSGKLTHFSEVWDNLPKGAGIRVRFAGIPARWSVGPIFTAVVHITRGLGNDLVVDSGEYDLRPVLPIALVKPVDDDLYIFRVPGGETTLLSDEHHCVAPGTGKYSGTLTFSQEDGIVNFLLALGGPGAPAGNAIDVGGLFTEYKSTATRTIVCVDPSPGVAPAVGTDTPVPPSVVGTDTPVPPSVVGTDTPVPPSAVGTDTPVPACLLRTHLNLLQVTMTATGYQGNIQVIVTDGSGDPVEGAVVLVENEKSDGTSTIANGPTNSLGRVIFGVGTTAPGASTLAVTNVLKDDCVFDAANSETEKTWEAMAQSPAPLPSTVNITANVKETIVSHSGCPDDVIALFPIGTMSTLELQVTFDLRSDGQYDVSAGGATGLFDPSTNSMNLRDTTVPGLLVEQTFVFQGTLGTGTSILTVTAGANANCTITSTSVWTLNEPLDSVLQ